MIPLTRWLEDAAASSPPPAPVSEGVIAERGLVLPGEDAAVGLDGAEVDQPQDYAAGLEEKLRLAREEAETARDEYARREAELVARLSRVCAETVATAMDALAARLRFELESSLTGVLEPFVEEQVQERALAGLAELICEAFSDQGAPELDLHCPSELHGALQHLFEERNLVVKLHDSSQLSVSCGGMSQRFEELSQQWLASIRETDE
jgi:hypothetical protein